MELDDGVIGQRYKVCNSNSSTAKRCITSIFHHKGISGGKQIAVGWNRMANDRGQVTSPWSLGSMVLGHGEAEQAGGKRWWRIATHIMVTKETE
jgi:hypothetical protein